MKKNLLRLLAAVMTAAMVLSLAACGGDAGSSSSSSESSSSEPSVSSEETSSAEESSSSSEESSSEASSTATAGKYESIQAFLDDPTVKSQLDSMIDSLTAGDDSMKVSVTAEGETLVYSFVFVGQEFSEEDKTTMHDALETAMSQQAATFEGIAASLSDAIEVSDPKVLVVYEAEDGSEIFSQEFSPSK